MARPNYTKQQKEIEREAKKIADDQIKEREEAIRVEREKLEADHEAFRLKNVELQEREMKIETAEKEIERRINEAAAEARREIEENEEAIRKDYLDTIKQKAEDDAELVRSEADKQAQLTISEAVKDAAAIRQKANEDAESIRSSMIEDLEKREYDLGTREEEAKSALSKAEKAERQAKEAQRKYENDTLQMLTAERLKRDEEIGTIKVALERKIKEYASLKSELESQKLDLEEEREYLQELREKYKTGSPEKVERLTKEKDDLQTACTALEEKVGILQQQIASVSRKCNGKSVDDLEKEIEADKAYITELEKELDQYPTRGEIARLQQEAADLAKLREENRLLHEDKNKLESQLAAAAYTSRELDGARLEAHALRALNDQMKEKLRYFSDAYDTVKEDKFAGLIQIDKDVSAQPKDTNQAVPADISLKMLVEHIRSYAASRKQNRLYYDEETIRVFLASLAASHDSSRLLLLQGLSGTGKSSLPRIVAEALGFAWNQVSVQPSWRDNRELLGYDNDFTHRFKETEFTKILYRASTDQSKVNIVVLDEVNLARIEYYFADFLSELEKTAVTWKVPLLSNYQPQGEDIPNYLDYHSGTASLVIGKNVWFVGTANNDDSTATITDKVYDRAQIIDMDHRADEFEVNTPAQALCISYETLQKLFDKAWNDKNLQLSEEAQQDIDYYIDIHLQSMDITFGNRIKMQLRRFVPVYMAAGGKQDDAIDYYLAHKILRRLDERYDIYIADELDGLENEIATHYKGSSFKETKAKIKTLKRKNFSRGGDE